MFTYALHLCFLETQSWAVRRQCYIVILFPYNIRLHAVKLYLYADIIALNFRYLPIYVRTYVFLFV